MDHLSGFARSNGSICTSSGDSWISPGPDASEALAAALNLARASPVKGPPGLGATAASEGGLADNIMVLMGGPLGVGRGCRGVGDGWCVSDNIFNRGRAHEWRLWSHVLRESSDKMGEKSMCEPATSTNGL